MIINGGIECGHGYEKPQATNRQKYYKAFAKYLKVRPYLFHKPLFIKCLKCSSKQLNIFTLMIIKYVKCSGEHRGRGAELRPHEVFQQGGGGQSLHLLGPRVDQGVPVPAGQVLFLFFVFFPFIFFVFSVLLGQVSNTLQRAQAWRLRPLRRGSVQSQTGLKDSSLAFHKLLFVVTAAK